MKIPSGWLEAGGGEGNIHHPLQASQSTNHDNPDGETVPETHKSDIGVDAAHGGAESFTGQAIGVELADHHVGRVRDDGAEDTGKVATRECDASLSAFTVVGLRAGEVVVDHFDNSLEGGELHHGVWDLAGPEGVETFVEAVEIV